MSSRSSQRGIRHIQLVTSHMSAAFRCRFYSEMHRLFLSYSYNWIVWWSQLSTHNEKILCLNPTWILYVWSLHFIWMAVAACGWILGPYCPKVWMPAWMLVVGLSVGPIVKCWRVWGASRPTAGTVLPMIAYSPPATFKKVKPLGGWASFWLHIYKVSILRPLAHTFGKTTASMQYEGSHGTWSKIPTERGGGSFSNPSGWQLWGANPFMFLNLQGLCSLKDQLNLLLTQFFSKLKTSNGRHLEI